jgi:hypothetical protein
MAIFMDRVGDPVAAAVIKATCAIRFIALT